MTVPASPTSMCAGPASGPGRTSQRSSAVVVTWVPSARRAAAISSVSRARNGWYRVDGPTEIAESTRARAVIDFEPGRRTVAETGPDARGAVHGRGSLATGTVCRLRHRDDDRAGRLVCVCGRYATSRSTADLAALFEALDETGGVLVADYNVAPTDPVPIVTAASGGPAGPGGPLGPRPPLGGAGRVR